MFAILSEEPFLLFLDLFLYALVKFNIVMVCVSEVCVNILFFVVF